MNVQMALTSICQEGLRWTFAPIGGSTNVQEDRLIFLSGLPIVAARLAAAVAARVAALATSLAAPMGPDEQGAECEAHFGLVQTLSGQSKAEPTARCGVTNLNSADSTIENGPENLLGTQHLL